MTWALMQALCAGGFEVQHFFSQACFAPLDGATVITGTPSRHLDSWLMSPDTCRRLFMRGSEKRDFAVVEGCFAAAAPQGHGGVLDPLCEWLSLPRLAVVDVSELGDCKLPKCPGQLDGILLDRVSDLPSLLRWQTILESQWGAPVLGALPSLVDVRRQIAELRCGETVPEELCQRLARSFLRYAKLARLEKLAQRRATWPVRSQVFEQVTAPRKLRVAVAYDAAFHCYFPDTLELLELGGAELIAFSPLRDESLPAGCELVYLGCGHPEHFAADLADNHCMLAALRNHVCQGGRLYAEGGGLAYLSHAVEKAAGGVQSMVAAIPAVARLNPRPEPPRALEVTLAKSTWLGQHGTRLKGYANSKWLFDFSERSTGALVEPGQELKLVACRGVIGSSIHLHFATQPELLARLFRPQPDVVGTGPAVARLRAS